MTTLAVVGATGQVGRVMRTLLEERNVDVDDVRFFASARSAGKALPFRGKDVVVEDVATADLSGIDVAVFSAGGGASLEYAPKFAAAGAVVVDNSSAWRKDPEVPLVVSEVNPHAIKDRPKGIVANPNCTTIMMVVVLQPLEKLSHIKRIRVSSYQSASGAGAAAMAELQTQYSQLVNGEEPTVSKFPHQLAYNVIPQVDVFTDNGYTKEEMKMYHETQKIMHTDAKCSATCVRVSSLRSHSESVWIETERPLSVEEARKAIAAAPGCTLKDDPSQGVYPMPLETGGKDDIFVGRIRKDLADENGLTLWLSGDQIRKGAALNAVQIAEYLMKNDKMLTKG